MDLEEIVEGEIVYLRFMHFYDDNTIDCRMNGRPYLVYKMDDDKVHLFGMTTKMTKEKPEECYYPIERKTLKGNKRLSYINLSNYACITKKELIRKINELKFDSKFINLTKNQCLEKEDMDKITERILSLCMNEAYKEQIRQICRSLSIV